MQYGKLDFKPAEDDLQLASEPTARAIADQNLKSIFISAIDASLADTGAFCEQYAIGLDVSANCVIVKAKRGEKVTYAAIMVRATDQADVNGVIRRTLDAKKVSFAPMDEATSLSGMEYGGINPIGLPADWPILVDEKVAALDKAIIGSGIRASKLLVAGTLLASLPNAKVLDLIKAS